MNGVLWSPKDYLPAPSDYYTSVCLSQTHILLPHLQARSQQKSCTAQIHTISTLCTPSISLALRRNASSLYHSSLAYTQTFSGLKSPHPSISSVTSLSYGTRGKSSLLISNAESDKILALYCSPSSIKLAQISNIQSSKEAVSRE